MSHRSYPCGLLLVASALGGCGGTDIRVKNESTYTLEQIEITTPSQTEAFGTLTPTTVSEYVAFDEAYQFAAATFVASGYRFEITPTDYSGEEELGGGFFTYHIAIQDFSGGVAYIFTTED